jgi:hypothetical protein
VKGPATLKKRGSGMAISSYRAEQRTGTTGRRRAFIGRQAPLSHDVTGIEVP